MKGSLSLGLLGQAVLTCYHMGIELKMSISLQMSFAPGNLDEDGVRLRLAVS